MSSISLVSSAQRFLTYCSQNLSESQSWYGSIMAQDDKTKCRFTGVVISVQIHMSTTIHARKWAKWRITPFLHHLIYTLLYCCKIIILRGPHLAESLWNLSQLCCIFQLQVGQDLEQYVVRQALQVIKLSLTKWSCVFQDPLPENSANLFYTRGEGWKAQPCHQMISIKAKAEPKQCCNT